MNARPFSCPKCGGQVFIDWGGEASCFQCGWTPPPPDPLPYVRQAPTYRKPPNP